MIIGTAGHIDHGKTSLVRALTGVDTDRLPEEKRRGITIELGFAPLALDHASTVGIVDVPGHEAFIRTMLAGATGVDLGLLVIAADEGVMPQTREHLAILTLLGVTNGVVALTKRDLVQDDDWMALVHDDVATLLRGSPLEGAPVVETSVTSGDGVEMLRSVLRERVLAIPERARDDLFRMPIDRAFTVKGTGTVVTGTVWSGSVSAETHLRLFPLDQPVRARGFESHGAQQSTIAPGYRAAIALAGVDLADVARGAMLVEDAAWVATRVLRADVALLPGVERPLRPREWVRLHLGTSEVGARVVALGGALEGGERRGARVVLDAPLVARAGDRFVIRRTSPPATIGGGVILDPSPPRRRARPWPPGLSAVERLGLLVDESGSEGLAERTLCVRLGLRARDGAHTVDASGDLVRVAGRVFRQSTVEAGVRRVEEAVASYHREHPLEEWASVSWIRATVAIGDVLSQESLHRAVANGVLEQGAGGVRRVGWSLNLSPTAQAFRAWLLDRLALSANEPPSVSELRGEREGNDPVPLLRILEKEGLVVQVEPDRYYAFDVVTELVRRLRSGMLVGRPYLPGELRDILGTSRKYLIPFLEYCDRQRITERGSSGRVLGL
ncbi:MAG: selenocysteine-specific translation elongation factor [Gemmatimonadaceae bacterium]|nr:selenocysteine-specific translation elongation factor [Gemmatimonadaceae bacterium]